VCQHAAGATAVILTVLELSIPADSLSYSDADLGPTVIVIEPYNDANVTT
jgi:hypothetical protein